ncbi:MAG: ROK family protein, partial [Deltaproteobacteria bacterium]|nr:ROK family protein [Deltaproteobacteria bacterium]
MRNPFLKAPTHAASLDPDFRPAFLAAKAFEAEAVSSAGPMVELGLEQPDGTLFVHAMRVLPAQHPRAAYSPVFVERFVKFLLWSRGGFRIHVAGPGTIVSHLRAHFADTAVGRFDSGMIGEQIYGRPIEVVATSRVPAAKSSTQPLGRHLNGNRIGFDLGGSDRKVAAVIDGKVVFSEETVWDPYHQKDPAYHKNGILDSLRKAAAHLPQVDAIGGSAAGVYVNSEPRAGSLFRGIPRELFDTHVKPMFRQVQAEMGGVPFEVVNDGEVTALAGAMSLQEDAVLGIALGTSTAAGYVTPAGTITTWLNELAFVPVDYREDAPSDEWSGDRGCGVQYLSQQAVGRLVEPAGITLDAAMSLPEKLVAVQELMKKGDPRATAIYQTLGVYLGYALAHFLSFYDFRNL